MADHISKQLLWRYLEGNCSLSEKIRVEEYLKSTESQSHFEETMDEYWSSINNEESIASKINYFSKFKQRYKFSINTQTQTLRLRRYLKYAAIFLVSIGSGFYFLKPYFSNKPASTVIVYIEKHNPRGQRSIITLPDSSIVYLGPDSHLKFCQDFSGRTREVILDGEAFFNVKHKTVQPFVVRTKNLQTIVLGTSFKVETFRPNIISVSVATGKVSVGKVSSKHSYQSLATLTPGQRTIYNLKTQQVKMDEITVNDLISWKDGGMVFRDMTLAEIKERLERWYNIKIVIENGMENFRLSASFDKVNMNEVLEVITRTANMKYTANNHIIYIKKRAL